MGLPSVALASVCILFLTWHWHNRDNQLLHFVYCEIADHFLDRPSAPVQELDNYFKAPLPSNPGGGFKLDFFLLVLEKKFKSINGVPGNSKV